MPDNTPWTGGKTSYAILAGVVPLAISTFLGLVFRPGNWFASLQKPRFMPPGWIFALAWTILYPLLGVSMIMACYGTDHHLSWILPPLNIILSLLFTPWMFGLHSIFGGFLITYICFILGVGLIAQYWLMNHSVLAACLMIPYVLWLFIASILGWYVFKMNRKKPLPVKYRSKS